MSPGDRLRRLREAVGHTQEQAARLVHLEGADPGRTWRRWEAGALPSGRPVPEMAIHLYALITGQHYEAPR